ncbi:MAG: JAB domain-containing protein [Lachnospiraceae bacterium]|nr:JAB domain-containing protein [Lachnospiraceae bacterium]
MQTNKKQQTTDMPYEKFEQFGAEALTEAELLAIILRTGTKDKSAVELAGEVLRLSKPPREGLLGLYDVTLKELMEIKGIGFVKAVKLKCLTELSMRISRSSAKEGLVFNSPDLVAQYFMETLRHRDTECVIVVCLDAKGRMIGEKKLSDGSVRMSLISPRQIFLEALHAKAVNIILVHNHPSGDPTPSRYDKEITSNLHELGEMMDILLLDHIIIGDNSYASMKELGYLT